MVTMMEEPEDKLARRKRIFNEVAPAIALLEPEEISKMLRQAVEDVECLREKEAVLRKVFADKISVLNDERLSLLRTYVPIPPSVYKDDAQEKRTRPTKDKDKFTEESSTAILPKPRTRSVSAEDKNASAIMKALGMSSIEEAKAWLESKKAHKTTTTTTVQPTDDPTPEEMDAMIEDDGVDLPE